MEKIINLGIPHIGEKIFKIIDTPGLIECALVSETWETLAHNVILKRWKGRLIEACEHGYEVIVRLLLENLDHESTELNARDSNRWTAFMTACVYGPVNVVQLILDHSIDKNIDLNARCKNGETAFMFACIWGYKDVIKLILDHSLDRNIDLNARSGNGWTALMLACSNGQKMLSNCS